MKVVTEILQDLEILKRLLKHNAILKIRINYYLALHCSLIFFIVCARSEGSGESAHMRKLILLDKGMSHLFLNKNKNKDKKERKYFTIYSW